jgi:hypothetical protein
MTRPCPRERTIFAPIVGGLDHPDRRPGNVSGTVVSNRDPPIREFFQKSRKLSDVDSISPSATT